MTDGIGLHPRQLDALREVATIGAGHAATALSEMTRQTIMIEVPTIAVTPLGAAPLGGGPDRPVAVVSLAMHGDLTGRTVLVLPQETAARLSAQMLPARHAGAGLDSELARSALMETGNILAGAYLNALSAFAGLLLLPSPPTLRLGRAAEVLAEGAGGTGGGDVVVCVETEFLLQQDGVRLRGYFLLLPDAPSLRALLRAVQVG